MICRHCNAKIKRGMKRCPYCGERLVDYRLRLVISAGIILALVLIVCAVSHLSPEGSEQTDTVSEPVHTTEGTEESVQQETEEEQTETITTQNVTATETQSQTEEPTEERTEDSTQETTEESVQETTQEEEEEPAAEPVSDRWSDMTPQEVSLALEQEEFPGRLQYAQEKGWLITGPIEVMAEAGTRSRTLKPDVLYTEEILQGLESGSFQMQAFSAQGYPEGEADYQ
ncbi:MAG TPA: hypothetical protein IAC64_12695, partial [Candidatus Caccomorpha excrementavium]|nr:hypothetical protein [Candidatus Caccomorpha excrementavium]